MSPPRSEGHPLDTTATRSNEVLVSDASNAQNPVRARQSALSPRRRSHRRECGPSTTAPPVVRGGSADGINTGIPDKHQSIMNHVALTSVRWSACAFPCPSQSSPDGDSPRLQGHRPAPSCGRDNANLEAGCTAARATGQPAVQCIPPGGRARAHHHHRGVVRTLGSLQQETRSGPVSGWRRWAGSAGHPEQEELAPLLVITSGRGGGSGLGVVGIGGLVVGAVVVGAFPGMPAGRRAIAVYGGHASPNLGRMKNDPNAGRRQSKLPRRPSGPAGPSGEDPL